MTGTAHRPVPVRTGPGGYVLDPDPARLDLDRITAWLGGQAYWALGRERAVIERSLAHSLVYGVYAPDAGEAAGEQVGLVRVVTDHATFAWLCDVFVDDAHRGRGLAHWAVGHVRDDVLATGVYRIILATHDAHGVYADLGFTPQAHPEYWMELITAGPAPATTTTGEDR